MKPIEEQINQLLCNVLDDDLTPYTAEEIAADLTNRIVDLINPWAANLITVAVTTALDTIRVVTTESSEPSPGDYVILHWEDFGPQSAAGFFDRITSDGYWTLDYGIGIDPTRVEGFRWERSTPPEGQTYLPIGDLL